MKDYIFLLDKYVYVLVEPETVAADQQEVGFLVIECLTTLLSGNSKNAGMYY